MAARTQRVQVLIMHPIWRRCLLKDTQSGKWSLNIHSYLILLMMSLLFNFVSSQCHTASGLSSMMTDYGYYGGKVWAALVKWAITSPAFVGWKNAFKHTVLLILFFPLLYSVSPTFLILKDHTDSSQHNFNVSLSSLLSLLITCVVQVMMDITQSPL